MRRLINILLICFITSFAFSQQNNEIIGNSYFKNGEFEKALVIYKELYKEKPYNYNYLFKVVETLQQLENYKEAERLLKDRLALRENPSALIELGYNYQLQDSLTKADTIYNKAIAFLDNSPNYIYNVARAFEKHSLLQKAIITYNKGKILTPERDFSLQLARIYGDLGDTDNMLNNYINFLSIKPEQTENLKRLIGPFISEDDTNATNKFLKRQLLLKLQKEPMAHWNNLLSWLYIQEKAYNKAFIQERALYKRNPESLDRITELAITAQNDKDISTAKKIFNYIISTSQDPSIKLFAHQYLLEIIISETPTEDQRAIEQSYVDLFTQYGKSELTFALQLSYANFLAFTLQETERASIFLKENLSLNLSEFQIAKIKLLLADILVLQERFNEALIFYSQIQLGLKNSTISQEARFKVAKTSYYKGDFEWAESQLKVLKSSVSQLIANDALDLKLLISDNKYEDSTQTALKLYAKADLYAFQNKTKKAITVLSEVLEKHKGETITDQALFKQAQLFEKTGNFDNAAKNYQEIINDYGTDILADDAKFHLAEIQKNILKNIEEAKALYKSIIFNHKDSIYFVEAQKAFRRLRGDNI